MTRLPASGREADAPEWPATAARKPTTRQRLLWDSLWAKPQAVMWERMQLEDVVARYVLFVTTTDKKLLTEARQLEDRLGLSAMALLRLRWEIVDDERATSSGGSAPPPQRREDPRLRLVANEG